MKHLAMHGTSTSKINPVLKAKHVCKEEQSEEEEDDDDDEDVDGAGNNDMGPPDEEMTDYVPEEERGLEMSMTKRQFKAEKTRTRHRLHRY